MTTYLNTLLNLITQHSLLAYVVIFMISLSESLAIVGLLVPGTVIMFGVGAVVAAGKLSLFPVLLMAMTGAVIGDGISYWLGHHYRDRLIDVWPFSRYPRMLKKGEEFFLRQGGKSVLLGRFVGPVRPVIPVVAGMLGMRPLRFSIVNILSAIGWALAYILPGVFFGTSLAVIKIVSTRLAVLVLIVVVSIWSLLWLSRKMFSLFERKAPIWLAMLQRWATTERPHQGRLLGFFKRMLSSLVCGKQGEEFLFAFLVLTLVAVVWGFLGVLQDLLAKNPLLVADHGVYHFLQSLRTVWSDSIFVVISELGDPFVNIVLFCTVLLVLLVKRCYRAAAFWIVAVVGGLLVVQSLKWAISLPPPVPLYGGASAYGFLSAHTTMSLILYGFLAILIVREITVAWRWGLISGVVLVAFVIGFSRLYLGAHWLSDVLEGYSVGAIWMAVVGIAYLKKADKALPKRLLGGAVLCALVLAGGWHVTQQYEDDISFYVPRHEMQTIAFAAWMAEGWRNLPTYRIDLAGEREQPLILQWAGPTEDLAQYLLSKGWKIPSSWNLKNLLNVFSFDTPIGELPVLPLLHNGRIDVVRLVLPVDKEHRWVLRLWATNVEISEGRLPVFDGTIEVQDRRQIANMILLAKDSGEYDVPLKKLAEILDGGFAMRLVNRKGNGVVPEKESRKMNWHGGVLLMCLK
jgi:undecaprenyl-diphosphatase